MRLLRLAARQIAFIGMGLIKTAACMALL